MYPVQRAKDVFIICYGSQMHQPITGQAAEFTAHLLTPPAGNAERFMWLA